ncbi:hypothetical protein PCASD_26189 [Puccinia coronata f. sp. avenae]|uniref:Uncharacterized protein n=1 Tax=Puccinia coronata f. sp. avenae TaxID=200324 RepID=A0A2N5RXP7_9BASI|nr:hypothetical protein PCASD_26189 [Puccinia coronata f. sp. avenae]
MVADALSRRDIPDDNGKINAQTIACMVALTELGSTLSESLKTKVGAGYPLNPFCTTMPHLRLTLITEAHV